MSIALQHFLSLLITIIAEFFVILAFMRHKPLKLLLYSVLINSFTLPLATYLYYYILESFVAVELLVFLAEGILLMLLLRISARKAFLISLAANFATAMIGLILFW